MNLKEDIIRNMVIDKLKKLHDIITISSKYVMEEREYVFTILDNLRQHPEQRITKIEINECNKLYRKYKK
jgi:hypothetical protein